MNDNSIIMTATSHTVERTVTNHSMDERTLILEPWGETFRIPAGASFRIIARGPANDDLEIVETDDEIIVWGWPGSSVHVLHNDDELGYNAAERPEVPRLEPLVPTPLYAALHHAFSDLLAAQTRLSKDTSPFSSAVTDLEKRTVVLEETQHAFDINILKRSTFDLMVFRGTITSYAGAWRRALQDVAALAQATQLCLRSLDEPDVFAHQWRDTLQYLATLAVTQRYRFPYEFTRYELDHRRTSRKALRGSLTPELEACLRQFRRAGEQRLATTCEVLQSSLRTMVVGVAVPSHVRIMGRRGSPIHYEWTGYLLLRYLETLASRLRLLDANVDRYVLSDLWLATLHVASRAVDAVAKLEPLTLPGEVQDTAVDLGVEGVNVEFYRAQAAFTGFMFDVQSNMAVLRSEVAAESDVSIDYGYVATVMRRYLATSAA